MSEQPEQTNPLSMYDITIPADRYTTEHLIDFYNNNCKRWCFQKEQGEETGYVHYQCRVSLKTKKRVASMITWMNRVLPGCHVSPTVNVVYYTGNEFYVMKEESRIEGPWSDRININKNNLQLRFRKEIVWREWQVQVMDMIKKEPDDRKIHVIVDPRGQSGKTFMCMYLAQTGQAQRVPQQKDARDIARMIMGVEPKRCYFIDLPRATSHRDQQSIYAAIEEIKNGYCYDDRYHFKERYFEPPHVFVFTNQMPDMNLVSRDRWKIYTMVCGNLVKEQTHVKPLTLNIINNN